MKKLLTYCLICVLSFHSSLVVARAHTVTNTVRSTQKVTSQTIKTTKKMAISNIRTEIVNYALQFKGIPYVWGGTSLTKGVDCSGFTQSVFKDNGILIPRTSRTQATGGEIISVKDIQPGDLVFYASKGRIDHVALYIGNGKVISASTPKTGVRVTNLNYRKPYKVVNYIG